MTATARRSRASRLLRGPVPARLAPIGVAAVAAGGLAVVHTLDPHEAGHYPTCPSLLLTGLYCPGCGTLRMLHDLTQGDLAGALAMNPLALVLLPAVVAGWVTWALHAWGVRPRRHVTPAWPAWVLLATIGSFWVLRNVLATSWLAPG